MTGDKAIRGSTIAAVSVVALVAAFVSYRHALTVVRAHGESGGLALAYPLTIDGMIYASSMVLLNAARRGLQRPWLAYAALALGIAATLAANVAAGIAYGVVGALVAAWPAPALVISYELLMLVIRSGIEAAPEATVRATSGATAEAAPKSTPRATRKATPRAAPRGLDAATAALVEAMTQGQPVPSARELARVHHIGRDKASEVRSAVMATANGHQAT